MKLPRKTISILPLWFVVGCNSASNDPLDYIKKSYPVAVKAGESFDLIIPVSGNGAANTVGIVLQTERPPSEVADLIEVHLVENQTNFFEVVGRRSGIGETPNRYGFLKHVPDCEYLFSISGTRPGFATVRFTIDSDVGEDLIGKILVDFTTMETKGAE